MTTFTIESTYRIPIYRQRSYEAETLAASLPPRHRRRQLGGAEGGLRIRRRNLRDRRLAGRRPAYASPALPIPSHFGEALQRKAEHFEVLLGLLKVFALPTDGGPTDEPFWRQRAHVAIAKAEAILAGARDPDDEGGAS